jgi:hypothetical protein
MPQPDDILDIQNRLRDLVQRLEALEAVIGNQQSAINNIARGDAGAAYDQTVYNDNKDAADTKINAILAALRGFGVIDS